MSPVRAALKRPVTVAMLCIAAMLFGLVALRVVPLQLLPEGFESAGMTLIFPYPNADPLSVERDVVRPVEEALGTVTALDEINVTASANRARIRLSFSGRTDMAMAALEVRDRLERIRSELPPEAQRFFLWRHSASSFPDMAFGVLVPESAGLEGFQIVARRLIPKLQRVDGIASVDTWGGLVDQQAYVELDEHRVRSHRVQLYDLIQRLSAENFTLPAGAVEDGGRRMLVRSTAPFNGLEDLERYPVDRNLTIGDLGEGVLRTAYRDRVSRMDGQAIVWLVINKESGRNTVEVCARMREAVEDLATDPALEGFQVLPIWDAGESIESALGQLTQSILWGGLLAVLCLFLFFRDLKATLVVAAAIPFSALVAMSVLVLFGYTLNVLSLAGLTLAVGMLVDNAIVVVENVVRRREAGEPMATAAAGGAGEVALAIALATFTTIAVFVPLVFVSNEPQVRLMISNLAGPISFGLLASLATAILVVPLLAVRLRTRATEPKGLGILTRLRRVSVGAADMALSHRVETLVLLIALLGAGSWFLSERVERVNDGPGGSDQIRVGVTLDASTTLYETHQIFEQYEQFLIPRKAE
ncbi:MAG: efflux RND transporter permease subunit, partial [Planctomycetota bacterium]